MSRLIRLLNDSIYALMVAVKPHLFRRAFYRPVADWGPDIVHAHDLVTLPTATKLADANKGVGVVYDAHEMEQYRNPPLSSGLRRHVRRVEKKHGRRADLVITVSQPISGYLEGELGQEPIVVYNSPQVDWDYQGSTLRDDLFLRRETPLLVYVGGIVVNRGVERLVLALAPLPGFHLALLGRAEPSTLEVIMAEAERIGVRDRVHYVEPVAPERVVPYISSADVGVYAIKNVCRSYDYSMPNKLFEMSFARLPIALNDLTAAKAFVAEYGHGESFDEEDVDSIAQTIARIYRHRDSYSVDEEAYRELEHRYGWNAQAGKLVSAYRERFGRSAEG